MPNLGLPQEVLQQAINLFEKHGRNITLAARSAGLDPGTLRNRINRARLAGLAPTEFKPEIKIHKAERLGRTHLVIPDVQAKPGVPTEHLEWIGNYIVEKQPDVLIQIGDFADIDSLNSYAKGKAEAEGKRLAHDISSVVHAMERLLKPIHDYNRTAEVKYKPEMHLTLGNHEYRMEREVEDNPRLKGMFDMGDLGYADNGWQVHDFLKVVTIDGVEYAHYFTSGNMGRPVTSAAALLRERQCSAIMGHAQHTDMAFHKKTQNIAMFCGICYLHDEKYLGPQGNNTRRQIVMLHEVENGHFDPMFVSLRFLQKRYS
jgi:hypothetical protein